MLSREPGAGMAREVCNDTRNASRTSRNHTVAPVETLKQACFVTPASSPCPHSPFTFMDGHFEASYEPILQTLALVQAYRY